MSSTAWFKSESLVQEMVSRQRSRCLSFGNFVFQFATALSSIPLSNQPFDIGRLQCSSSDLCSDSISVGYLYSIPSVSVLCEWTWYYLFVERSREDQQSLCSDQTSEDRCRTFNRTVTARTNSNQWWSIVRADRRRRETIRRRIRTRSTCSTWCFDQRYQTTIQKC